jgi:hypothetical protein
MTADRYQVDAGTRQLLGEAYRALVKAGNHSVVQAWRFGQTIDSFSDTWTMRQLADAIGIAESTVRRYWRLYGAYQRPELALAASQQVESYNIDVLVQLVNGLEPMERIKPLIGRRYASRCTRCHSSEHVRRVEIDPETGEPLEPDEPPAEVPGVLRPRFRGVAG